MRALALLASLPPEGLMLESPRLAISDPHIWLEAFSGSAAGDRRPIGMAAHEVLFSEGLPRGAAARYATLMTPESPRALTDAHVPGPILSAYLAGVPALVIGGTRDRLVTAGSTLRTALYHGAARRIVPGAGHFLQLDPEAATVAGDVLEWIEAVGA
jgi:pimeloyl-ACP methyl ester carboxylesterase